MAKLLFITQKVDKDDDVLGVYHRWIEELSKKADKISVVCLYKGRSELPGNVRVFSLGKEILSDADSRGWRRGFTRIKYILRFYKYIWGLRKECDSVFVHMNPIYIVLGGLFWKALGKKVLLWYNHPLGNLTARFGIALADKVFCTSRYSFSAKYRGTEIMPVGVDTSFFEPMPEVVKKRNRILYLGRISPIKKIGVLIDAVKMLEIQGLDFELWVVGSPASPQDKRYEIEIKKTTAGLFLKGKVVFKSAVPHHEAPKIYNSAGVFVNLTPTGSFDKTILEAMACETPVLVANRTMEQYLPKKLQQLCLFQEDNAGELCGRLEQLFELSYGERQKMSQELRDIVTKQHSMDSLIERFSHFFESRL
ncbi:MAG: glycosyltransferase family 4 protein [Parcubacteria group bacterium]|nr:glycosyltransferase family 4 protein [Parcubacteria group bacterium]